MPRGITRHLSLKRIIYACGLLALLGALVWYTLFQARLLITGPTIALTVEPPIVHAEPAVTITGSAHNIVSLTLNDRTIFTDDAGAFTETLVLPEGYTIMTLKARDRYGRETTLERPFVRTPLI